jgi:hypothetical protein
MQSPLLFDVLLPIACLVYATLGTAMLVGTMSTAIAQRAIGIGQHHSPARPRAWSILLWLLLAAGVTLAIFQAQESESWNSISAVVSIWSAAQGTIFGIVGLFAFA